MTHTSVRTSFCVDLPTLAVMEEAVNLPFSMWSKQCHAVSWGLVQFGCVAGRVARGVCKGVAGQHSWIVVGDDCYARDAVIVDPTLWSYDTTVKGIWIGTARADRHHPHGMGNIWSVGRPPPAAEGFAHVLKGQEKLPLAARHFLEILGPLDIAGWASLARGPLQGWPAAAIIGCMCDDPELCVRVPIDVEGMITDRNPGGLYLRAVKEAAP